MNQNLQTFIVTSLSKKPKTCMEWFENSFKLKNVGKVTNRCQKYVIIEMPNQQFRIQAKNEQYFLKNPKFKESAACTNS